MHYFLETGSKPSGEDLEKLGLGYALGPSITCPQVLKFQAATGEPVRQGYLFSRRDVLYDPSTQRYEPHPTIPKVWICVEAGTTPSELEREEIALSGLIQLGDGQDWKIPIYQRLPHKAEYDNGKWGKGPVLPRYVEVERIAKNVFSKFENPVNDSQVSIEWGIDIPDVCTLIGNNYYLSEAEIGMLGLVNWDADFIWSVLMVLIDLKSISMIQSEKKTSDA